MRFSVSHPRLHGEPIESKDKSVLHTLTGVVTGRNAVFLQAKLLNEVLRTSFDIVTNMHATRWMKSSVLRSLISSKAPIICHYGSFDPVVFALQRRPKTIFVYHNHTPLRFYWKWRPRVALLDLMTEAQLRLMPKDVHWVAVSEYNRQCLHRLGFAKVDVCPCIVLTVQPDRLPDKTSDPSVLFVGHIWPHKNCIRLVSEISVAANILRRRVTLRIVGDPRPGFLYGKAFQWSVSRLSSHKWLRIEWLPGILPEEELDSLYGSSWLYVSTSLHEGFGLPACESVMRGTPAVYLECGGQESVLGQAGMVRLSERQSFGHEVARLLLDEPSRGRLLSEQKQYVSKYVAPEVENTIRAVYMPLVSSEWMGAQRQ